MDVACARIKASSGPVPERDDSTRSSERPRLPPPIMHEPTPAPSGAPQVFVIDDDPGFGLLLTSLLREAGLVPVVFTRGADALAALEGHDPRAVCLDVMLADETGEQILVRLRERRPELPVIMLSAQSSVERAVLIMKL